MTDRVVLAQRSDTAEQYEQVLYGPDGQVVRQVLTADDLADEQTHSFRIPFGRSPFAASAPFAQSSWVYAIISNAATTLASAPLRLWRRRTERQVGEPRQEVLRHRLIDLLNEPNQFQDRFKFIETWVVHLLSWGNVWLSANPSFDDPRELFLFGMDVVRPEFDPEGRLVRWKLLRSRGREPVRVPLDALIHWALPNPYHPVVGLPPHVSLRAALDADYQRLLWDKFFFANRAVPSVVLINKRAGMSREQRKQIEEIWQEAYGGVDRAGTVAVLGNDFDVKILSQAHDQSQFVPARRLTRQEVAAVYGYPSILLNDNEGGGLGRELIQQARLLRHENIILPLASRFVSRFNPRLVWRVDARVEFDFDFDQLPVMIPLLRERAEVYRVLVQWGQPPNSAAGRVGLGMPSVQGGEVAYLPSTMVPYGSVSGGRPAPSGASQSDVSDKPALPSGSAVVRDYPVIFRQGLKRFLFEIRNYRLKHGRWPLDETLRVGLRRVLGSVVTLAFASGVERVMTGSSELDGRSVDELRQLERSLRSGEKRVELEELGAVLDVMVERAEGILRSAWVADDVGVLADPVHLSVSILRAVWTWAQNAGVYEAAARLGKSVTVCTCCSGVRYPGDIRMSLDTIRWCRCRAEVADEGSRETVAAL